MKETLSTQVLFGVLYVSNYYNLQSVHFEYVLVDVTRLYRGPFKEGYRQFINLKKEKKGLELKGNHVVN